MLCWVGRQESLETSESFAPNLPEMFPLLIGRLLGGWLLTAGGALLQICRKSVGIVWALPDFSPGCLKHNSLNQSVTHYVIQSLSQSITW